jgi:preprotein translocase subunit SecG
MSILIGIATLVLIVISLFLILVVLAQKAKSDGGVGAAMGGGMAEATFGAETGNVLSKATINASIAFFVLSFLIYLGHIYQHKHDGRSDAALPTISGSVLPAANSAGPAPAPAPAVNTTPAQATTPAPTAAAPSEEKK